VISSSLVLDESHLAGHAGHVLDTTAIKNIKNRIQDALAAHQCVISGSARHQRMSASSADEPVISASWLQQVTGESTYTRIS